LPKQKKVPHRQVKSLLGELAAEAKMMLTTKDHQVNECQQLAQTGYPGIKAVWLPAQLNATNTDQRYTAAENAWRQLILCRRLLRVCNFLQP
jgi:hypothetical protein